MGDRRILTEEEVTYEGLFEAKELYRIMDDFFDTKGYDKAEPAHREQITEKGKDIHLEYTPHKKVSDYFEIFIEIEIDMRDLTDVETEIDGKRKHLKKGEINIGIKTILESDYEGRWEQNAFYYMWRTIIDKFFYKKQTQDFQEIALKDTRDIKERLGSYLNLQRYKKQ